MPKKRTRKPTASGERERGVTRRRSKLPIIVLMLITAFASLALVIAGILNFGTTH
jgi:hypothetical protein